MKTVNEILGENQTLRGAVRVLTGKTHSGKRAIYISGNPAGLRLLADIMRAQADAVGSGGGESRYFFKLERQSGSLFFATDDSVDIFEIHCDDHYPEKHETSSVRRDGGPKGRKPRTACAGLGRLRQRETLPPLRWAQKPSC
jgi:hypothetical protein